MAESPPEPTSLVLELLRVMRGDTSALRAEMNARFDKIEADISSIKAELRGFQRNTIAEVYKANLTVSSFLELEGRVAAIERKLP